VELRRGLGIIGTIPDGDGGRRWQMESIERKPKKARMRLPASDIVAARTMINEVAAAGHSEIMVELVALATRGKRHAFAGLPQFGQQIPHPVNRGHIPKISCTVVLALLIGNALSCRGRCFRQELFKHLVGIAAGQPLQVAAGYLETGSAEHVVPAVENGRHAVYERPFHIEDDRLRRPKEVPSRSW